MASKHTGTFGFAIVRKLWQSIWRFWLAVSSTAAVQALLHWPCLYVLLAKTAFSGINPCWDAECPVPLSHRRCFGDYRVASASLTRQASKVCHNRRIHQHRVLADLLARQNLGGLVLWHKLHRPQRPGWNCNLTTITPGNTDDRTNQCLNSCNLFWKVFAKDRPQRSSRSFRYTQAYINHPFNQLLDTPSALSFSALPPLPQPWKIARFAPDVKLDSGQAVWVNWYIENISQIEHSVAPSGVTSPSISFWSGAPYQPKALSN